MGQASNCPASGGIKNHLSWKLFTHRVGVYRHGSTTRFKYLAQLNKGYINGSIDKYLKKIKNKRNTKNIKSTKLMMLTLLC